MAVGGRVQIAAGLGAFLLAIPSAKTLDPPYEHFQNPMVVDAIQPWADRLGTVCIYTIGLGLIASGVSLLLRFRRAVGDERRQLLWLVFAVAPLPLYVVVAFVSSQNGAGLVTIIATGGFITVVPIAAGLSVLRYRLYDVERIVAATVTWVLLTTIVVATYTFVVWLGARAVAERPGRRRRWPPRSARWQRPVWRSRCAGRSRTRWTGGSTGGPTTRAA